MRHPLLLLATAFLLGPLASAQNRPLEAALGHFEARQAAFGFTAADLEDVAVTDQYTSRRSGATHLYLRQRVNGVEVFNGRASAHVTRDGRVLAAHAAFARAAAQSANAPVPTLSAEAAVEAAARHLGLELREAPAVLEPADERHRLRLSDAGVSLEPIPAQLVYFATEDGALRLAWDVAVYQLDARHYWSLRVDAHTGAVLDQTDWVVDDEWMAKDARPPADLRPLAPSPAAGARAVGSYNVWALPLESPIHGERSLALDAADAATSPLGWHSTGTQQYTITRGNNVHAYEDRAGTNVTGYSPDGGGGLVFDFDVDFALQPETYRDAAITNLFYWTNVFHDVLYRYGFDEAAGNFQQNNFGNGGAGNDYLLAEAQDGSGTNNANFSSPPDGIRPRMQMFEWEAPPQFTVTAPAAIAGFYDNAQAAFGPAFPETPNVLRIVPVDDPFFGDEDGGAGRACSFGDIFNAPDLEGNIALIERGDCNFIDKVRNAQQAGAVAVIVHNNARMAPGETGSPEDLVTMGLPDGQSDDVTIPSTFVRQSTGLLLTENQPAEGYVLLVPINRDSDLDAGVIVHEFGHGLSTRLTGGPSNSNCLNNQEQMGEGWSDYYGLMLTMREGDTAEQGRGVGTYLQFEEADGRGIRPYPYSTSMAVNPTTYGQIGQFSVPHGVGSVWANMLWEMTWNLIESRGFAADVYDAEGMAGNQVALNLVTEGLKLQPCGPGFVTGRDAILAADTLLYDGAHAVEIWTAFAKRGLGYSASQGSSNNVFDGAEAYDLPPNLTVDAAEGPAGPTAYRLSGAYPNPVSGRARLALEVAEAQAVRVGLYDALGREVARLFDGAVAAGSAHAVEVDASGLAAGVYVVRAVGEAFTATQRLTVLR